MINICPARNKFDCKIIKVDPKEDFKYFSDDSSQMCNAIISTSSRPQLAATGVISSFGIAQLEIRKTHFTFFSRSSILIIFMRNFNQHIRLELYSIPRRNC